ncbi:MAG: ERAP1-like C-terminal domain-containing protein [Acidobacteria bacterium]|nr:ERAP1-like C-terminal domain-containing protein [Acidobacteriota bacterium]
MRLFLFLALVIASATAQPAPEGIPRQLARQRAAVISHVRYELSFRLQPKAESTPGTETLEFDLAVPHDVLLDYREGRIESAEVNSQAVTAALENGHLRLPRRSLRAGHNAVKLTFTSRIATAGYPLTRYEDRDDGTEYIYTLFVPMDASMAFPCFDQPDLKAKFRLQIAAPRDWTVVANTAGSSSPTGDTALWTFAETNPISTYLFAFAAGHFKSLASPGLPTVYVRQSKLERARSEAPQVQQMAKQGIDFLQRYFAQPFPFPKYDMVLIPGFAYGGMEHAGATFLREESVLFRTAPTRTDLFGRDVLVLHELTHQWFGDLVTMRWFDDLWLKEGFAQYMAYRTLAGLDPDREWEVWKRFYEAIKPGAYGIDATRGTTPIYQDIPNLKDAKSAYGAIVYSKAPAVLKQLAYVVDDEHFRDGLRLYLKEHAYANAEWSDLVHALERTSGQSLGTWAEMWIRHRGMPQVEAHWSCAQGIVTQLKLTQHDVLNEGGIWPVTTLVALHYESDNGRYRVQFSTAETEVSSARGAPCPEFVFANDIDYAYGRFLLDPASRDYVVHGGLEKTQHMRPLLWGSLWEAVRVADLDPAEFLRLAEELAPQEQDESLTQTITQHMITALHRYVSPARRMELVPAVESAAADRMQHADQPGLRIIWFRALRGCAESAQGRQYLKQLLSGELKVPGVELRQLDRWNLVSALVALNDSEAPRIFSAEKEHDRTGDGLKYAFVAEAASPDVSTKQKYFDDYLHNAARPEDWVEQSLGPFNYWNQAELTAPYLRPALEALPRVKRERKIFFLVNWLNAFIGGQQSAASDAAVHQYIQGAHPERDLELKILQAVDELDRTVMIRNKFP